MRAADKARGRGGGPCTTMSSSAAARPAACWRSRLSELRRRPGAAARGRPRRHRPLHPSAGRLLQDDHRPLDLGLQHRAARPGRPAPDGLSAGPRARAAAARSTRWSTRAATPRTTTPGPPRRAAAGWSYADVLPYFRRAEDNERLVDRYHGSGGPLGVVGPGQPALPDPDLRARGAAGGPALQPRLQRRAPGGLRPLPGDPARRAPLQRGGRLPQAGARRAPT